MTPFDPLIGFAEWWQKQPFNIPPSLHDGVTILRDFTGLVLYRGGPYQVQLWICKPNAVITEHGHPNIDTIAVYVSGQLHFTLNRDLKVPEQDVFADEQGMSSQIGATFRVKPTDTHGAKVGPLGGAFIVIQHWLDGKPRSTELNWKGEPLDEGHKRALTEDYENNPLPCEHCNKPSDLLAYLNTELCRSKPTWLCDACWNHQQQAWTHDPIPHSGGSSPVH